MIKFHENQCWSFFRVNPSHHSMFALKDNFYLTVEISLINPVYIDIYRILFRFYMSVFTVGTSHNRLCWSWLLPLLFKYISPDQRISPSCYLCDFLPRYVNTVECPEVGDQHKSYLWLTLSRSINSLWWALVGSLCRGGCEGATYIFQSLNYYWYTCRIR